MRVALRTEPLVQDDATCDMCEVVGGKCSSHRNMHEHDKSGTCESMVQRHDEKTCCTDMLQSHRGTKQQGGGGEDNVEQYQDHVIVGRAQRI